MAMGGHTVRDPSHRSDATDVIINVTHTHKKNMQDMLVAPPLNLPPPPRLSVSQHIL